MTMPKEEFYMWEALTLAREAAAAGEVPVGCVIVRDGAVISRGRNRREEKQAVCSHAEMEAMAQANAALGSWRLDNCALYVTLEPCPMCAGAIINSRIRPDSQGVLRRTGQCLRRLRRRDQPVYGAVPSPTRSGGRNFGRGLSSGTGGIFRETPPRKAVDAKFLRNAERFKTFVTTPAGLLNNSPVS